MKVPSSLISGTVKSSSYFSPAIGQETLDDLENDDSIEPAYINNDGVLVNLERKYGEEYEIVPNMDMLKNMDPKTIKNIFMEKTIFHKNIEND